MNSVFVYCELEGTQIEEVSFELLTKGRKLASELGVKLEAVVAGHGVKARWNRRSFPMEWMCSMSLTHPVSRLTRRARIQPFWSDCLSANSRKSV